MAETLAVNGGQPVRSGPLPARALWGQEEKDAAMRMFDEAIESGGVIGYSGPEELAYEKEFAEYMGGGYVDLVNSGTNAVYCALGALQLPPGSEVVVPPITDPGGCMPVALHNLIPIVADAARGTFNAGAREIEAVITERTSAILIAHIAGEPCDMGPIMAVAEKYNLPVIEDCAQSHGARYDGQLCGTFGAIAAVSTMSGKHHATGPQGGVVFSRSEELIWEAKRFADRGKPFNLQAGRDYVRDRGEGANVRAGLNLNGNDLSAAIGRVGLGKLENTVQRRRAIADGIVSGLAAAGNKAIKLGYWPEAAEPSHWFLRVHVDEAALVEGIGKKEVSEALGAEGFGNTPSYRWIPSEMEWFVNKNVFPGSDLPWSLPQYKGDPNCVFDVSNAIEATDSHINVAIHENWGQQEVDDLVAALVKIEKAYGVESADAKSVAQVSAVATAGSAPRHRL